MQRQYINQYFNSVPFEKYDNGEYIVPAVAVASQIDGYGAEEFLGARNQIDYRTGCIEVKVAVTDSGSAVLAESYSSIGDEPVNLSSVIKQMQEDSADTLVINLSEYSRLSAVNYVLINSYVAGSCVITGVDENAFDAVKSSFPKLNVLCNYGKDSVRTLEELKEAGASGIMMTEETFDKSLAAKAKELDMLVWVDCGDDILTTVEALKFHADGIISSRPGFAHTIINDWNQDAFERYFKRIQ